MVSDQNAPMAASSVASQLAITASPISAAVVYYLAQISGIQDSIHLLTILMVTVPSTLIGTLLLSLYSLRRGADLDEDPEYQRRLRDPLWRDKILHTTSTSLDEKLPASAKHAVLLFILALVSIVVVAMVPEIRTIGDAKPIKMSVIIQMMMLAFGGLILLVTRTNVQKVPEGVVFKSGMVAAIAIFGIAWMSDTYFQYAMPSFKSGHYRNGSGAIRGPLRWHYSLCPLL